MQSAPPWMAAPFLRIVIPFCVGILIAEQLPVTTNKVILLTESGFLLIMWLGQLWLRPVKNSGQLLFGILINLQCLILGIFSTQINDQRRSPHWFGNHLSETLALVVEPLSLPAIGQKSVRFTVQVRATIQRDGVTHPAIGQFLLYVPLNQQHYLKPGAIYLMGADRVKMLKSSGNPGGFDYAAYNRKKNIYHQVYQNAHQLIPFPDSMKTDSRHWLTLAQQTALDAMNAGVPQPHNQLAKALLIGYREEVDKELLETYSNTGVVHVIAVSGMHLGLLFLLLQRILIFPETRFPATKWIKFVLVIAITWFFAAVAGSAGSIIRAAAMFSYILFAKLIRKPLSITQSLSVTALALLVYDPYWIWDAGLLLSFTALISIVLYQPIFQRLLEPKHPLLKWCWELTSVTIAAQLLTFPLCISLFHQAPVYFLPANMLAVPLSSLALIGTLVLWVFYVIGLPTYLPGMLNYFTIDWMNKGIAHIARLPGALLTDFNWNLPQLLLSYAIIFLVSASLLFRNRKALLVALLAILGFISVQRWQLKIQAMQAAFLVYHLPGKSAIQLNYGRKAVQVLNLHTPAQHVSFKDTERYFGIEEIAYKTAYAYSWQQKLLIIPPNQTILNIAIKQAPSWIVLNKSITHIRPLLQHPPLKSQVIIDGSVSEIKSQIWAKQLREMGVSVHSTWEKGAFLQPLNGIKP